MLSGSCIFISEADNLSEKRGKLGHVGEYDSCQQKV